MGDRGDIARDEKLCSESEHVCELQRHCWSPSSGRLSHSRLLFGRQFVLHCHHLYNPRICAASYQNINVIRHFRLTFLFERPDFSSKSLTKSPAFKNLVNSASTSNRENPSKISNFLSRSVFRPILLGSQLRRVLRLLQADG